MHVEHTFDDNGVGPVDGRRARGPGSGSFLSFRPLDLGMRRELDHGGEQREASTAQDDR